MRVCPCHSFSCTQKLGLPSEMALETSHMYRDFISQIMKENFPRLEPKYSAYSSWKSIYAKKPNLKSSIVRLIGDGKDTNLWQSAWLNGYPLRDQPGSLLRTATSYSQPNLCWSMGPIDEMIHLRDIWKKAQHWNCYVGFCGFESLSFRTPINT